MPDDDDGLAEIRDGGAHGGNRRAGRELVACLRGPEAKVGGSLAGTQQRARKDGVGLDSVGPQFFAQLPGLLVPFGREGAQLIRLAGCCFGMTDEDQAHGAVGYLPSDLLNVVNLRYVVADVFTDTPLTGNQLAVFTDGREVEDDTMQDLAREMNYSETVFVLPTDGDAHARIRIFTPATELPFAGHPVLGSAFVLGAPLQLGEIRLETGAGVVPVTLEREGARIIFGRMQQPIPRFEPFAQAEEVEQLLGIKSQLPVEAYFLGPTFAYFELSSEEEVAGLSPDFGALGRITEYGVYCFAGSGKKWKSRMFAPTSGVAEDPATGSAAGPLGVHLVRHGRIAFGDEIEITQGVELKRPSKLYVRIDGSGENVERVEVGGSAVVVARGEVKL